MADLEAQLKESSAKLKELAGMVSLKPIGTALPITCYENWADIAVLHRKLGDIIPLFEIRGKACLVMKSLVSQERKGLESKNCAERQRHYDVGVNVPAYSFDAIAMDFAVARHLAIMGYVCSTWAIYDRVANVCGRLVSNKEIAPDPWSDPKLWEHLMGDGSKGIGGFSLHQPLFQAYGWPVRVSYKTRNWLVHDGGDVGKRYLFRGDQSSDGYLMHQQAINDLQRWCDYKCDKGKISRCCLQATEEPWPTQDLCTILEKYNTEIDVMLTCLVKWSVDSLLGQVKSFSERDEPVLRAAYAAAPPAR